MRNRKVFGSRYFFRRKAQAETKAGQLRTQRKNEGASACLSAADRLDAESALSPSLRHITEACGKLQNSSSSISGSFKARRRFPNSLANKLRDGASARYVRDLRSRLNIFAASFAETNVTDLSTAAIDDWLRNWPHSGTTRNNYRRLVSVLFRYGIRRGHCLENPAQRASRRARKPNRKSEPFFKGCLLASSRNLMSSSCQGRGALSGMAECLEVPRGTLDT
jgi:hypothetical protein